MELSPQPESGKATREPMAHRRIAISTTIKSDGHRLDLTAGFYPDGRLGEIFLNADRANSLLDFLMSDSAILASLALQFGAPLDVLRHAMKRDTADKASSPIGEALDVAASLATETAP
jgi:hypothetical protein